MQIEFNILTGGALTAFPYFTGYFSDWPRKEKSFLSERNWAGGSLADG